MAFVPSPKSRRDYFTRVVLQQSTGFTSVEEQKKQLVSQLPPVDREKMTKIEIEFRELLEDILYTDREIEAISNPRLRAIYEGIAASYYEPAVYRAFEVLYEDYRPLRVAGRIVHNKLMDVMEESKVYRDSQIKATILTAGMTRETAESSWSAFIRLAKDKEMTVEKVKSLMEKQYFQRQMLTMLNNLDERSLEFEEFVKRLRMCSDRCPNSILQDLLTLESLSESLELSKADRRRAKYNQRYDYMIEKFGEWKAFIPDGEGRQLDILRGCFVGSENAKVVEALRVIYTDYNALRLSGDWIFKIVSTIMARRK